VRRLTLRLRIVLVLLGLVAAGLMLINVVIHESLQGYLLDRVDKQLSLARFATAEALQTGSVSLPEGSGILLPPGTYGALVSLEGKVIRYVWFIYSRDSGSRDSAPRIPADIVQEVRRAGGNLVMSLGRAGSGDTRYRVEAIGPDAGGITMVVGIPLAEIDATLHHALWISVLVSLAVLAGLGFAAWWLVRRELRPLEDMARTAADITGGDLAQRVEPAESDTEVGRLGLALNAMLKRIEEAFAQQEASEKRMRRFLADASHELRTPLTSIRGYAELFHRGAASHPDDLAIAMRRIEDEARRMGVLVEDLLLLARLDDHRPLLREPLDLGMIVADAVHDARVTDPDRTVALEAPATLSFVGDDNRLRQVVANLVGNAVRHTPPESPIEVSLHVEGDSAVFAVADHGPGISPEDRERVFQPFFRLDEGRSRRTGGAGLGLAIVRAVVEAHGGSVTADETPGGGATFAVRLPLATAVPDDDPHVPAAAAVAVTPDNDPAAVGQPAASHSPAAPRT